MISKARPSRLGHYSFALVKRMYTELPAEEASFDLDFMIRKVEELTVPKKVATGTGTFTHNSKRIQNDDINAQKGSENFKPSIQNSFSAWTSFPK